MAFVSVLWGFIFEVMSFIFLFFLHTLQVINLINFGERHISKGAVSVRHLSQLAIGSDVALEEPVWIRIC